MSLVKWSERLATQQENFAYFQNNEATSYLQLLNTDEPQDDDKNKFISFQDLLAGLNAQFSLDIGDPVNGSLDTGNVLFVDSSGNLAENAAFRFQGQAVLAPDNVVGNVANYSFNTQQTTGMGFNFRGASNQIRTLFFKIENDEIFSFQNDSVTSEKSTFLNSYLNLLTDAIPSAAPVDGFSLYSSDFSGAGTASPFFLCEDGILINLREVAEKVDTSFTNRSVPFADVNGNFTENSLFYFDGTSFSEFLNVGYARIGSRSFGQGGIWLQDIVPNNSNYNIAHIVNRLVFNVPTTHFFQYTFDNTVVSEIGEDGLKMFNSTTAAATKADSFSMYSEDFNGAGTASPFFLTEDGEMINLREINDRPILPTFTEGSIPFADSNGDLTEDNVNFNRDVNGTLFTTSLTLSDPAIQIARPGNPIFKDWLQVVTNGGFPQIETFDARLYIANRDAGSEILLSSVANEYRTMLPNTRHDFFVNNSLSLRVLQNMLLLGSVTQQNTTGGTFIFSLQIGSPPTNTLSNTFSMYAADANGSGTASPFFLTEDGVEIDLREINDRPALPTFTDGSIPFANSTGGLTENNTELNYDGTSLNIGSVRSNDQLLNVRGRVFIEANSFPFTVNSFSIPVIEATHSGSVGQVTIAENFFSSNDAIPNILKGQTEITSGSNTRIARIFTDSTAGGANNNGAIELYQTNGTTLRTRLTGNPANSNWFRNSIFSETDYTAEQKVDINGAMLMRNIAFTSATPSDAFEVYADDTNGPGTAGMFIRNEDGTVINITALNTIGNIGEGHIALGDGSGGLTSVSEIRVDEALNKNWFNFGGSNSPASGSYVNLGNNNLANIGNNSVLLGRANVPTQGGSFSMVAGASNNLGLSNQGGSFMAVGQNNSITQAASSYNIGVGLNNQMGGNKMIFGRAINAGFTGGSSTYDRMYLGSNYTPAVGLDGGTKERYSINFGYENLDFQIRGKFAALSHGRNFIFGGTASDADIDDDGDNVLYILNGDSVPTLNPTDAFGMYSADANGSGTASPFFLTEDGIEIDLREINDRPALPTFTEGNIPIANSAGGLGEKSTLNYDESLDLLQVSNRVYIGANSLGGSTGRLWLGQVTPNNTNFALEGIGGGGNVALNSPGTVLGFSLGNAGAAGINSDGFFVRANYGSSLIRTRLDIGGQGNITFFNSSIPATSETNAFKMYATDIVAGNAAPHFRTEAGDIIKLYKQADVPDTSGANLAALEAEVNALKAVIREAGLMG